MLSLNLLSPKEKMASSLMWKYVIIKNSILIVLVLSAVISLVLLGAKTILKQELAEVNKSTKIVISNNEDINYKINYFNAKLKKLSKIQENFIPWSIVLKHFNDLISPGITFDNIVFDSKKGKLQLDGFATSRKELLALQKKIDDDQIFTNSFIPLNDLLKKNNVQFSLTADLKLTSELIYD